METMSPQQGTMGQNRSDSLTGESNKKVPQTLLCRTDGAGGCMWTRCAFLRTEMPGALIKDALI